MPGVSAGQWPLTWADAGSLAAEAADTAPQTGQVDVRHGNPVWGLGTSEPDPFQGFQRVLGGSGDRGCLFVPVAEGFPGGERGAFAAGAQVRLVTAGGFFGEEDADDFGGVPALGFRGGDE